jgi:hypothetical protein
MNVLTLAEAGAATNADHPDQTLAPSNSAKSKLKLRKSDWSFVTLVGMVECLIFVLAINSYFVAHELELLKHDAEAVAAQIEAIGKERADGASRIANCSRSGGAGEASSWSACWGSITALNQIAALKNPFNAENETFAASCDQADPKTVGTIVVEKGLEWFSAGTTGTYYSPFTGDEAIEKELPIRVKACGRWSESYTVREIKF